MSDSSPLSNARFFKYPTANFVIMTIASIMCGVVCVSSSTSFLFEHRIADHFTMLCFSILSGIPCLYTLNNARNFRSQLAVDSSGIRYIPKSVGSPVFLSWQDVGTIEMQDSVQRLVVKSASSKKTINIEYQINDFKELRSIIFKKSAIYRSDDRKREFIRSKNQSILLVLLFVVSTMLIMSVFSKNKSLILSYFTPLFVFSLVAILFDPSKFKITNDAFVIFFPAWKRVIPFSTVRDVVQSETCTSGKIWTTVAIELENGKSIVMPQYPGGSIALYNAMQSAWLARQ